MTTKRLEPVYNMFTHRNEVEIDCVIWFHWISGYCGRLFATIDKHYIAEMNDGTLIREGTLDELRWMVGNYHKGHRLGTKPNDKQLLQLASENNTRPLMRGGAEYEFHATVIEELKNV